MLGINATTSLGTNTGKPTGDIRMGRPKYLILSKSKAFTASDLADSDSFKAALKSAMLLSRNSLSKVYLLPLFRVVDDKTADPNTQTLADGYQEVLNESNASYQLQSTAGICQQQQMVQFNGWRDGVFVIDSNNFLFFVVLNNTGIGFTTGYLYTDPPRWGNSQNIVTSKTILSLGAIDELKANIGALKINFDPTKLQNTVDVNLAEVGAAAGYVWKVGGTIACAGIDIYTDYQDLLAVVGAWKATLLSDGSNITVTTVVKNAVTKGWDITLNNSPVIAASAKIKLELVDPTALAALGTPATGIESFPITVIKP